ncbi:hypothetical protein SAMN05444365_105287 [Micromonospora pattaloongensis]|uniref:Rho termination factor, N-terminal domain n=1 Tax=Micromonospora pattaloongensis TaxID=405436 RepID=A0A1H3Q896_9ACTN|nr:hypothetical protein [Micromonospora pattaloongensis]SDZ09490.1 hypothetical protein SAMN05444365_105287 [Micromonospora pattaloongensis]
MSDRNVRSVRTGEVQQRAREAGIQDVEAKNKGQLLDELNARQQGDGGRGGGGGGRRR